MAGMIASLVVVAVVASLIFKKHNPQFVLLVAGIVLLLCGLVLNGPILPPSESTGLGLFDVFKFIGTIFSDRLAGLGLNIMLIGGFAMYMSEIGASKALVRVAAKPLGLVSSPHVLLSLTFLLGVFLTLFITSASGLGLLLMTTVYPILVRLGCSRASAASVIATTGAVEWGPGAGNSLVGAKAAGLDPTQYFVSHQIEIAVPMMIAVAVLHGLVSKWFDSRSTRADGAIEVEPDDEEPAPRFFALLPAIPLVLMLTFSNFGIESVRLGFVPAVLISICVAILAQYVRVRAVKETMHGVTSLFKGMGAVFATVVTLIVAAETFARGIGATGSIDSLTDGMSGAGFGSGLVALLMSCIVFGLAALTGSGNAALFSFAPMVQGIAQKVGVDVLPMIVSVQFSAGPGRSISPVAAVVVAVAGLAKISPVDIVKRTFVPMLGGWIVALIAAALI